MNLPKIQAMAAPLSAPIPSALGVAAEAYNYMSVQSIPFWGWVAAVGAFVGIETMGGASCYALVKLHRERNYGVEFALAFVGILVYIASGWYTLSDSPMIIFFFLAPFSYFAYSILRSMEKEIEDKVTETETQIKLIQAETRRINAETRKTKAGAPTQPTPYQRVEPVALKPCLCGATFTRSQDKAIHARRCEVWRSAKQS